MSEQVDRAHLIGSVPLRDSEAVFRQVAGELGPYLRRLPDGETGERGRWIFFQAMMLRVHPAMEEDPTEPPFRFVQWDGKVIRETKRLRFKPGIDPQSVTFDTGYDRAAAESYGVFSRLRRDGVIPSHIRFQVSLPTPMASGFMYVSPKAREAYLPVYERGLLTALHNILAAIPAEDLAIQWDVCQEVLVFEDYFPEPPADYKAQIFAELGRLGDAVPAAVEMGYHLCYGSPQDEHLVQPKDMAILVELMNGIGAATRRRVDFLHAPVPKPRSDDAYFAPLADWRRRPETRLYLGLIHFDDREGDTARIAAAHRAIPDFGIASECGWGRTDPARVPALLASHRAAAEALP
ncbi:MAG: hypothetical protein JO277_13740 [Candidatus Eremiobacteraeota bacterium]|nr:hypothetical protein [Candidatus Eremiobacteraeota bacterium]